MLGVLVMRRRRVPLLVSVIAIEYVAALAIVVYGILVSVWFFVGWVLS